MLNSTAVSDGLICLYHDWNVAYAACGSGGGVVLTDGLVAGTAGCGSTTGAGGCRRGVVGGTVIWVVAAEGAVAAGTTVGAVVVVGEVVETASEAFNVAKLCESVEPGPSADRAADCAGPPPGLEACELEPPHPKRAVAKSPVKITVRVHTLIRDGGRCINT